MKSFFTLVCIFVLSAPITEQIRHQEVSKQAEQTPEAALPISHARQAAIETYQREIQVHPDSAFAFFKLGELLSTPIAKKEAIESFQKAIKLDPSFVEAYNALGWTYLNLDFPFVSLFLYKDDIEGAKNAIKVCKKGLSINPAFVEPYLALGIACNRLGRYRQATTFYEKAISLNSAYPHAYNGLAYAYQCLGRLDEAIQAREKAIGLELDVLARGGETIKPTYMPLRSDVLFFDYIELARLYTRASRYEEAIETYNKAIELKPEDAMVHHNQGLAYLARGDKESAFQKYNLLVGMMQSAKDETEKEMYQHYVEDLYQEMQN
jgi:tetratricopeptide (TPR) repeat protein